MTETKYNLDQFGQNTKNARALCASHRCSFSRRERPAFGQATIRLLVYLRNFIGNKHDQRSNN